MKRAKKNSTYSRQTNQRNSSGAATGSTQQRSSLSPSASASIPAVFVKTRISHTAVFRKQIESVEGAQSGDLVAVYSKKKELLGYGLYNARSEMSLRMLWRTRELPTDEAWNEKLRSAVRLRLDVLRIDDTADTYRVVHAESDGLPGLMIDRFGDVLSAEAFSLGMYQRGELLLKLLSEQLGTSHTILQTSPQFLSQEGVDPLT